jgi:hypothetical protein
MLCPAQTGERGLKTRDIFGGLKEESFLYEKD